jgi:hypothetical protein
MGFKYLLRSDDSCKWRQRSSEPLCFWASAQSEREKEAMRMKAWTRRLVIACAVTSVVLAVLAAAAFADRPIKQVRPQYVEWGDPDYPLARTHSDPVAVAVTASEDNSVRPAGVVVSVGISTFKLRYTRNGVPAQRSDQKQVEAAQATSARRR